MRFYHRLGSFGGIEFGVHISWYLIFFLLAFSLGSGFFPMHLPGLSKATYAMLGTLAGLLLFLSVLIHECAHAVVAKGFGLKINRVFLFFFGGVSNIDEEGLSPRAEIWMASAGPICSLVLGFLFSQWASLSSSPYIISIMTYLSQSNFMLGLFNLIPGFPMDGGRIMRGILWACTGRIEFATWYATRAGKIVGCLLIILGGLSILFGDGGGVWLILLGIFLFMIAESSFEELLVRVSLSDKTVQEVIDVNPIIVSPDKTIEALVKKYFLRLPYEHIPVMDHKRFLGVVSLTLIRKVQPSLRSTITVSKLMIPASRIPVLKEKSSLLFALQEMVKHGVDVLPVMKSAHLKGVVTRESVVHFLQLECRK